MANPPDIDVEPERRNAPSASPGSVLGVPPPPVRSAAPPPVRRDVAGDVQAPALPPADRVADAVDTVGREVGRVFGYVRARGATGIRADAERAIIDSPALALAAALGLGYLVGRQLRR